jgi:Kdo2-lipid IVA lauroyltransferase/acyltransferase
MSMQTTELSGDFSRLPSSGSASRDRRRPAAAVEAQILVAGQNPATGELATGELAPPVSLPQRLAYGALLAAAALGRTLPMHWSTAAWSGIARTVGPRLRQHRRALANLAVAFPEKSDVERQAIARAMWGNMGRIFAETLMMERLVADPSRFEVVDRAQWQQRMAGNVPSIGCTLHMGNWELAIWPMTLFGRKPSGVYKPLGNPLIDRWLVQTRATLFTGGLLSKGDNDEDTKSGQRAARQLIGIARKGGCIGFVCDHVDRRRGTAIPFMGREAKFTVAPALIARHVGAKVWLGRCLRIGTESRFRMDIRELEVPQTDDKNADAIALTRSIFAVYESWIREAPEQWMWWNTRWTDEALSGRDGRV